jgi:hypothetical protein
MNKKMFFMTRMYSTAIVTIAIWLLLSWNHYHGGVPSHHILARKDLPEISNWWGGLLLPLLTLFLFYRMEKRVTEKNDDAMQVIPFPRSVIYGFVGGLFFGITLSAFFTFGNTEIPGYMLMGLLILSLFLPIYRAECLLGFVIGMTYTFGAVLPTGIGSIFATIGVLLYILVRPMLLFITSKINHIVSSK